MSEFLPIERIESNPKSYEAAHSMGSFIITKEAIAAYGINDLPRFDLTRYSDLLAPSTEEANKNWFTYDDDEDEEPTTADINVRLLSPEEFAVKAPGYYLLDPPQRAKPQFSVNLDTETPLVDVMLGDNIIHQDIDEDMRSITKQGVYEAAKAWSTHELLDSLPNKSKNRARVWQSDVGLLGSAALFAVNVNNYANEKAPEWVSLPSMAVFGVLFMASGLQKFRLYQDLDNLSNISMQKLKDIDAHAVRASEIISRDVSTLLSESAAE